MDCDPHLLHILKTDQSFIQCGAMSESVDRQTLSAITGKVRELYFRDRLVIYQEETDVHGQLGPGTD